MKTLTRKYIKLIIISILILNVGFAFSQNDCGKYPDDYIPRDLNDALTYLNCVWSEQNKEEFRIKNEGEAVAELHQGAGQAIRNNWGLWGEKKNSLVKYFNKFGIYHPDDISAIILTSFHRKLNNKVVNLEQQVDYYLEYWKAIEIKQKALLKAFKTYAIGDTVTVPLGVMKSGNEIYLNVLSNHTDEKNFDCIVHAVIVDKTTRGNSYTLNLRLIDLCNFQEVILGKEKVKVGQTFKLNMKFFKILDK